jgi:hypothetical protein
MEEIDGAFDEPFTATMQSAQEQAALDWLRTRLQQDGSVALDRFVERLRSLYPTEARMFGEPLPHDRIDSLTTALLDYLTVAIGRRPLTQGILEVTYLSPENHVQILEYKETSIIVEVPYEVEDRHLLDFGTYVRSLRPARQSGRPRKTPKAPSTRTKRPTDDEARRAWAMHEQGFDKATIARTLSLDARMTSKQEHRRVLAIVDRRIVRGRRLASDATPTSAKKVPTAQKKDHDKNPRAF